MGNFQLLVIVLVGFVQSEKNQYEFSQKFFDELTKDAWIRFIKDLPFPLQMKSSTFPGMSGIMKEIDSIDLDPPKVEFTILQDKVKLRIHVERIHICSTGGIKWGFTLSSSGCLENRDGENLKIEMELQAVQGEKIRVNIKQLDLAMPVKVSVTSKNINKLKSWVPFLKQEGPSAEKDERVANFLKLNVEKMWKAAWDKMTLPNGKTFEVQQFDIVGSVLKVKYSTG